MAASLALAAVIAWLRTRSPVAFRASGVSLALFAAFAVVATLRVQAGWQRAEQTIRQARAVVGRSSECLARATVLSSPLGRTSSATVGRERAPGADRRRDDPFSAIVELGSGRCDERSLDAPLRVRLVGLPEDLGRGDAIEVVATVGPIEHLRNAELPDPRSRVALDGCAVSGRARSVRVLHRSNRLPRQIDAARTFVRGRIERSYPPRLAPYARALVLGETDLGEHQLRAFRRSGLAHLLAVSGTHLVVTILALCAAIRSLLARVPAVAGRVDCGALSSALGVVAAPAYADFAGGSGSAKRAAVMLSIVLLARAAGRRPSTLRCFAVTLAGFSWVEPLALTEPSFLLSVSATFGLMAAGRWAASAARPRGRLRRGLGRMIGATLGASAGCLPVLLWWGVDVPVLGVAANLIAAPLCEAVALPCCLAHAALFWLPVAERGASVVASGALSAVEAVAFSAAAPRLAALSVPKPTAEQLGAALIAGLASWQLGGTLAGPGGRRRAPVAWATATCLVLVGGALLEHAACRQLRPSGILRVTVLDVGQGDALLVDLPDGSLLLVDSGSGVPRDRGAHVVEPTLRARRRSRLDRVVLTHPHEDHVGGAPTVLRAHPPGELWLPALDEAGLGPSRDPGDTTALVARRASPWLSFVRRWLGRCGVRVRTAGALCQAPTWAGAARIDVLSPCPAADMTQGANHDSLVLRIRFGLRSVLLMADADTDAEAALLGDARAFGHVDLLKVGHHGSRTSTGPPLLSATRPDRAVVSSGARNRLGHPAPEVLDRLARWHTAVWQTAELGSLRWQTDGLRIEVAGPEDPPVD